MDTKPIPGLSFSWADGRRGTTKDYLGSFLVILIVSLDCALCARALRNLRGILLRSNVPHLALCDLSTPADDQVVAAQTDFPKVFATLPEIYLGLNVPRGTWIKYPTLVLLDEQARVTEFCNEKQKVLDASFLESVLPAAVRIRGQR